MQSETIIRGLTICSLSGLLLGVGLRITFREVLAALKRCRLALVVAVNFVIAPGLAVVAVMAFRIKPEIAMGMILLAAAPFAPVVPIFARMARADLALAAGLTAIFPLLSAFLTPFVVAMALCMVPHAGATRFDTMEILLTLLGVITLPLAIGMGVRYLVPALAQRGLRPVEIVAEAAGAFSLAFVTLTEWRDILATDWISVFVMGLLFELWLGLGWLSGGPARQARRVIGLGTSNRNIALALLMSLESFAGTPVVPVVVANGLLLIFLGLCHVGFWRFGPNRNLEVAAPYLASE